MKKSIILVIAMILFNGYSFGFFNTKKYIKGFKENKESLVIVKYEIEIKDKYMRMKAPKSVIKTINGTIVSKDGIILLSGEIYTKQDYKILSYGDPQNFKITLYDNTEFDGELLGEDSDTNLLFIKIKDLKDKKLKPISFDNNYSFEIGEKLLITGFMEEKYQNKPLFNYLYINGIVGDKIKKYTVTLKRELTYSGGLIINKKGKAVGLLTVDTIIVSPDSKSVPTNIFESVFRIFDGTETGPPVIINGKDFYKLIKNPPSINEEKKEGWLGIFMKPLTEELSDYWKLDKNIGGIVIEDIIKNSAADKAFLESGDIILKVDGKDLNIKNEGDIAIFTNMIKEKGANENVVLTILSEGKQEDVTVTLQEMPTKIEDLAKYENDEFGLKVRDISLFDQLNNPAIKSKKAVIVTEIENAGWVGLGGLQKGDIIKKVNEFQITDCKKFEDSLNSIKKEKNQKIVFFIIRGPKTLYIPIIPNWN